MRKRGVSHTHATFVILILAVAVVMTGYNQESASQQITGNQVSLGSGRQICEDKDGDTFSWLGGNVCGTRDCDDTDASVYPGAPEIICSDGVDYDCDNRADCADSDCNGKQGSGGRCEYGTEVTCDDMFDNDADGKVDGDDDDCTVGDTIKQWHPYEVTIDLGGSDWNQDDTGSNNPFIENLLIVTFTSPTNKQYVVHGYFDSDGEGAPSGTLYTAKFGPPDLGSWDYDVSFKDKSGNPLNGHGTTGTFTVVDTDGSEPLFMQWGWLEFVGEHYLKFRDGDYWIKNGPDSPETFLAYEGFPDTTDSGSGATDLHHYDAHAGSDYNMDPLSTEDCKFNGNSNDCKGIIGALNYLASADVNSIYFTIMNIGADGRNVWPYVHVDCPESEQSSGCNSGEYNDPLQINLNKMEMWDRVFSHAEKKGISMNIILGCEAEEYCKRELDDGDMGPERHFLFREMIARFGYHNAIQWITCEEYGFQDYPLTQNQIRDYGEAVDFYDWVPRSIGAHNANKPVDTWRDEYNWDGGAKQPLYEFLAYTTASMQYPHSPGHGDHGDWAEDIRDDSNGKNDNYDPNMPRVVELDEPHSSVDQGDADAREQLKEVWLSNFLSGVAGIEIYFKGLDQSLNDFRTGYETHWKYLYNARKLIEDIDEFHLLDTDDSLDIDNEPNSQVMFREGETYLVMVPDCCDTAEIVLPAGPPDYTIRYYDPIAGQYDSKIDTVPPGSTELNGNPLPYPQVFWVEAN